MTAPHEGERRRPGIPARIGVSLAGAIFALCMAAVLGELYLRFESRVFPPNDGWTVTWGHRVVNNRFGFREREFKTPKPSGSYRVMVLGDSLTWGAGLSVEERYSNLLEKRLRGRFPGHEIEVLNFGFSGGPTTEEARILKRYIDVAGPDLVVVGFCLNDTQPFGQNWSPERQRYAWLFGGLLRLRRMGLVKLSDFLTQRASTMLEKLGLIPEWQVCTERSYARDSEDWRNFVRALGGIKAECDSRGMPPPVFAVLNQGTDALKPTDYGNPDDMLRLYLKWYRQAEDAARDAGFLTVNFEEEFAQRLSREPLAVNSRDGHPSARCNEVYAEKLDRVVGPVVGEALDRRKPRPTVEKEPS